MSLNPAPAAQRLYWLARYLERAAGRVRLLAADAGGLPESEDPPAHWLAKASEMANSLGDFLPDNTARLVEKLHTLASQMSAASAAGSAPTLERVLRGVQSVAGHLEATMYRDAAYEFIVLGRHIERAEQTLNAIIAALEANHSAQWLLQTMEARATCARHVSDEVTDAAVLYLLLADPNSPAGMMHNLEQIARAVDNLPDPQVPINQVEVLQAMLHEADLAALAQERVRNFIDAAQLGLNELGEAIADTYFQAG